MNKPFRLSAEEIQESDDFWNRAAQESWIVLVRKPGSNALAGRVEHSFHMDFMEDRVRLWLTETFRDNFFGKLHKLSGKEDADREVEYVRNDHPDWEVDAWHAHDSDLPVTLDWEKWVRDCRPGPGHRKFGCRNIRFRMK